MATQVMIKMVLDIWHSKIKESDTLFDKLSDEQLQKQVVPGRNSGIYLLGHLVAVHDRLLPLLGLGERLYPQLDESFIDNPDGAKSSPATISELRQYWKNINTTLAGHFSKLEPDQWFQKHNSVSAADFEKEPHRNKLNVIINRTNHLSYHLGQLVFLK
jgi:hypothetical protein